MNDRIRMSPGSTYHPTASLSMTVAATAPSNPLHDFVLVVRRLP